MPTIPTHAVAALGIGALFYRPGVPKSLLAVGAAFATLPDLDVIGFSFGIRYGDLLGHRGLSHSLAVAAALATLAVGVGYRKGAGPLGPGMVWVFLALVTASHGILDAFTDGGLGIALLAPFSAERYFAPYRPIAVSPIGLHGLLQPRMLRVMGTEFLWIWCPSAAAWIAYLLKR